MKAYIYRGKRIFVAPLLGGDTYGTVWMSSFGGTHRVKVKALPVRGSREEAQRDLDAFAGERKLKEAGGAADGGV